MSRAVGVGGILSLASEPRSIRPSDATSVAGKSITPVIGKSASDAAGTANRLMMIS